MLTLPTHEDSLALISRFRLMFSSAASTTRLRWTSGGMRTMNLPLYRRELSGSGEGSPLAFMSSTTSATSLRIPRRAFSGVAASQLRLGNSAHFNREGELIDLVFGQVLFLAAERESGLRPLVLEVLSAEGVFRQVRREDIGEPARFGTMRSYLTLNSNW